MNEVMPIELILVVGLFWTMVICITNGGTCKKRRVK